MIESLASYRKHIQSYKQTEADILSFLLLANSSEFFIWWNTQGFFPSFETILALNYIKNLQSLHSSF